MSNSAADFVSAPSKGVAPLRADSADDTADAKTAKAALRARFVAYDLPPTFADELLAATNALKSARQLNQAETQEGVSSTAELSRLLIEGNEIVTHLDAVMHNKYARVPETLREWESAKHVERSPRRGDDSADAGTPPTPPPAPSA